MAIPLIPAVFKFLNDNGSAISALAGVVVAAFTGTLWWVTWGLVRIGKEQRGDFLRSLDVSETAANAAKLSADASVAAERAYVFLEGIQQQPMTTTVEGELILNKVSLLFLNYGRTPANIVVYRAFMRILDHVPGPADEEANSFETEQVAHTLTIMIGADKPWRPPDVSCWETEKKYYSERGSLLPQYSFYVWGHIKYRTLFQTFGETRFKRRWVDRIGWVSVGAYEEDSST